MEDLWLAGILGFGWQKERREAEFVKEPNLNESELKLGFFRTITSTIRNKSRNSRFNGNL